MKYWEIIADSLKKRGWTYGYVSTVDSQGRTIWIVDAYRGARRPKCESGESDASLPEALARKSSIVLEFVLERAHGSNGGPECRLGV